MQNQLELSLLFSTIKGTKSHTAGSSENVLPSASNDNEYELATQIEKLANEVEALKKQNKRYEFLLQLNDDSIFVKSASGKLVYANPAFLEHYPAHDQSSLIGTKVDTIFSKKQAEQFLESDNMALTNGYYEAIEPIILPDEKEIVARVTKKVFKDPEGNQFIACISKDISEREALIADLHRSNEDLDNFAYSASHDLKAPLNAIQTMLQWVAADCDEILPQESKDNLALALSRAKRMQKLLTDLLEYSRIGRSKTEPVTFNLRDKVFEWLELVDLPMGFGVQCDNVDVFLPETPLSIILVNLISNAIKHHDSITANLKVKVRFNKNHTVIEVLDDGPGIADKYKNKVFELFQTLKSRDEVEASGMGLSVVKKIVLNYGGKIAIKDNSPRGCRFIIHWPVYGG